MTGRCHKACKRRCPSSQRDAGEQSQGPKPQQGRGAHPLRVIPVPFLFAIAEVPLTVPTGREMRLAHLGLCFPIALGPVPRLGEQDAKRLTHNPDLAARARAHTGGDTGTSTCSPPRGWHLWTTSCSVTLASSSLSFCQRQPGAAVSSGTRSQRLLLRPAHRRATGTWCRTSCPTGEAYSRLKIVDQGFHQRDLALEWYPFGFADHGLSVQLRSQRTWGTERPCSRRRSTMPWSDVVA